MTWHVRRALQADAAAIRVVAAAAWRETYAALLRPATLEAFLERAYSPAAVERRIAEHLFVVAVRDEQLGAFADAVEQPGSVILAAIYALPERRGEGAGTRLLADLRDRFPDLPITADVLVGNRIGEAFYASRGFTPGELLTEDLCGETVTEQRWRLDPAVPATRVSNCPRL